MLEPDNEIIFEEDGHSGQTRKFLCRICRLPTNHHVLKSVRSRWFVGSKEDWDIAGIDDFLIARCNGCETLQFCKISSNSEDFEPVFNEKGEAVNVVYPDRFELYPTYNDTYESPAQYLSMPNEIRAIYVEAYGALVNNLPRVGAVATRMVIEAICLANGISKGTLQTKIDKLKTKDIITSRMQKLLHSVRIFGNINAHQLDDTNLRDLTTAWEAVNILMKNIYGTEDKNNYFEAKTKTQTPF